jgi:hypothetical protein
MVVWFPPNHGKCDWHLWRTIYPSCKKPHTHYTTNMRGPTLMLVTPKIKLITFLNEGCKILPQRFEGQFSRCQDDLNTSLAWIKHNKHNLFTQNTSLKRTHNTCNLLQHSLALCYNVSEVELTVKFVSQHISTYLSWHGQAVCDWAYMPTVCLKLSYPRYV